MQQSRPRTNKARVDYRAGGEAKAPIGALGNQARGVLQQQARVDDIIDCYNHERPHQALDMRYPGELYAASFWPPRLGELA